MRRSIRLSLALVACMLVPVAISTGCTVLERAGNDWRTARRDSSGQAPDPASTPEAVIQVYAYPNTYRTWPGPNSNTFVAHIARAVPELGVDLPPTAIGKDYLPGGAVLARSPSGTGVQVSVLGAAGVLVGWEEGIEINLLGFTLGLDFNSPGIKLPGLGRFGFPQ